MAPRTVLSLHGQRPSACTPRETAGRRHPSPQPASGRLGPVGVAGGLCQAARPPGAPRLPNPPASQKSDIRCPGSLGPCPCWPGRVPCPGCGEGLGVACLSCMNWRPPDVLSHSHSQPLAPVSHARGEAGPPATPGGSPSAWPLGCHPCCGGEQRVPKYASCPHPFPFLSGALMTGMATVTGGPRPMGWQRGTRGQCPVWARASPGVGQSDLKGRPKEQGG